VATGDRENGNRTTEVGTTTNHIHGEVVEGGFGGGKALSAQKPADPSAMFVTVETYPLVAFGSNVRFSCDLYAENVKNLTIMFHSPTIGDNNRCPVTNLQLGAWQHIDVSVMGLIRYEPPDAKTIAEATRVYSGPFETKKGEDGKPFHVNTWNVNFEIADKTREFKVLADNLKFYRTK
jgi:hypothetical protein